MYGACTLEDLKGACPLDLRVLEATPTLVLGSGNPVPDLTVELKGGLCECGGGLGEGCEGLGEGCGGGLEEVLAPEGLLEPRRHIIKASIPTLTSFMVCCVDTEI